MMPCANRSPFMRLTFLTRSAVRDRRSRLICRRSSCSGVGAFAMAQDAARDARFLMLQTDQVAQEPLGLVCVVLVPWASKALTKAAPSTPSVLTRRRRRDVAMEAGSTTWLSMFAFEVRRHALSPGSPRAESRPVQASLMDHNQTVRPPCPRLALCLQLGPSDNLDGPQNLAKRPGERLFNIAGTSPRTWCLDIFSPLPGDNDVTSHVVRLSPYDTKIALRSLHLLPGR